MRNTSPPRATDTARRLLLISYLFPPSLEIGGHTCAQIGRHLPRYGWEPVVLTVSARDIEHLQPAGESTREFSGRVIRTREIPHPFILYRRMKRRLRMSKASGLRDPQEPASEGGMKRWVGSLLAVPDRYTGWIPTAVLAGLRAIQREGIECLCSSGPPWTSHLVGLILASLTGLPWIAHFRDPWTDPWQQTHRLKPTSALSAAIERKLEQMVVQRADTVVAVTSEHTELFRAVYRGIPSSRFVTIPNGFDGEEWPASIPVSGSTGRGPFTITYAGSIYDRRDPMPVLRALRALIDESMIQPDDVRFEIVGANDGGAQRLIEQADRWGVRRCLSLAGTLSRCEAQRRMMQSNLLLLLAEGLTLQIPGKTYEYLRAGRPILALTSDGAVSRLLRRTGGAWIVDPADHEGIVAALREAHFLSANGSNRPPVDWRLVERFDRRALAGGFAALFDRAVSAHAARFGSDRLSPGPIHISRTRQEEA